MNSRTLSILRRLAAVVGCLVALYLASTLAWNYWPGFRQQDIETCSGRVLYDGKWSEQIQYLPPACRGLVSARWWEFGLHFTWGGADIAAPFVGATAVSLLAFLLALGARVLGRCWRRWYRGRRYAQLLRQKGLGKDLK